MNESQQTRYPTNNKAEDEVVRLYKNISYILDQLKGIHFKKAAVKEEEVHHDDNSNAWMYILFVLTFYAFSIVVLMVKYIKHEREGSKLEYYYTEFVKREWYKDKNLYDNKGRRIHYDEDGKKVVNPDIRQLRRSPDEPEIASETKNEEKEPRKKSVVLCLEGTPLESERKISEPNLENTGAVPKKSSLKNWPVDETNDLKIKNKRKYCLNSFHQNSLEDALEMRNHHFEDVRKQKHYPVLRKERFFPHLSEYTNPEDDEFFQVSDVELETIHSSLELLPTRANLDLSFN